jgi:hypothetical protein
LLYWPIAEVSAWDRTGGRKQAHPRSVATAVLKALYIEEGLPLPALLESPPSEAAGDAASADGGKRDTSPEEIGMVIAAEVARTLLAIRQEHSV